MRCFYRNRNPRRGYRPFSNAHHDTDNEQPHQTIHHTGEGRHQGKDNDGRDQYFTPPQMIGQEAHCEGRNPPGYGEHTNCVSEIFNGQSEFGCHRRPERRQNKAVQTHKAKGQAKDQDDLPLVVGVEFFVVCL